MLSITTENLQSLGRTEIPPTIHISIQGQAGLLAWFPVGAAIFLKGSLSQFLPFQRDVGKVLAAP